MTNINKSKFNVNKFGDRISWEYHVIEIITKENPIFYKYNPDSLDHNTYTFNQVQKYTNGRELIDCGCLIGRFIEVIKGAGYNYTGVDQSEYAIKVARRLHPDAKFINTLLWEMNFNEEFDVAFFNAVLQHNTHEEKRKTLPKVYQALKKGGVLTLRESTVKEQTETQLTYEGWIKLVESFNFKFKESWHKNELNLDDNYLFVKE